MNKTILMVIALKEYQEIEYGVTKEVLEKGGITVKTASLEAGMAKGSLGGETKIDLLVENVNLTDFNGVIFVGGQGMIELVDNKEFITLAKNFYKAGKITAAICVAPKILAKAGLLTDKQVTSWEGVKEYLKKHNAIYTGDEVTQDKQIITANGPMASSEFGSTILKALK